MLCWCGRGEDGWLIVGVEVWWKLLEGGGCCVGVAGGGCGFCL